MRQQLSIIVYKTVKSVARYVSRYFSSNARKNGGWPIRIVYRFRNEEPRVILFVLDCPRREKMADPLTKYGIYIDDFSKILILEPEAANQSNKLKNECQNFVSSKSCCHAVSTSHVNKGTLALLSLSPDRLYWQHGSSHCPLSLCVCVRYLFDEHLRERRTVRTLE